MSRCFPFPPPGYEKKLRVEDVTLLAKEKDNKKKEKKHKKDKDKEKKEGRDKDKERSKDRHKEKDKSKDRDKRKSKKRSRDEKTFEGDRSNVEKAGSSSPQSSCVQELEQRVSLVDGATGTQIVRAVNDKDPGKAELLDGVTSRSNGACRAEGKSGLGQVADRERDNCQSTFPKVALVFGNGAEQKTTQSRPTEYDINKLREGKEIQKHHNSKNKGEKSKEKSAKRHKVQTEMCIPQTLGYNGTQIDPPKEAAIVQELERRIRDENGATGSQVDAKANVTIQRRAENSGTISNSIAFSSSQIKEGTMFGNGSCRLKNGPKDNGQLNIPKVAIVHNFKKEERGSEMAGVADMSKKAPVKEMTKNGFRREVSVDNRLKIHYKGESGSKSGKEDKVREETENAVKFPRFGLNGSDSTDSSKHYTVKIGNKTGEAISGKRKEPEANGTLLGTEAQPNKWQKAALASQPASKNGRHLKWVTTITLSASKQGPANGFKLADEACKQGQANGFKLDGEACKQGPANGFKLDGEERKSNWTVHAQLPSALTKSPSASVEAMGTIRAQSPSALTKSPSASVEAMGTTRAQSPLGSSKPSISARVDGKVGTHGTPSVPKTPQSSSGKVRGTMDSQESFRVSAKPLLCGGKDNGTMGPHNSSVATSKAILHTEKVHETFTSQELAKPPSTPGKINGATGAHGLPPVTLKAPSTSRKEKRKDKSSKPPPPHPDTKYLSQILSVPKLEELPELDNPDWLFDRKSSPSKGSDVGHDRDGGEQVWGKALHIVSADVFALPYVIPY